MKLVRCAAPGDWTRALHQADCEVGNGSVMRPEAVDRSHDLPHRILMMGMQRYNGEDLISSPYRRAWLLQGRQFCGRPPVLRGSCPLFRCRYRLCWCESPLISSSAAHGSGLALRLG